jgi:hypothetical protein
MQHETRLFTASVMCSKWHIVQHGDHCSTIWNSAKITSTRFHELNPYVQVKMAQCSSWTRYLRNKMHQFCYWIRRKQAFQHDEAYVWLHYCLFLHAIYTNLPSSLFLQCESSKLFIGKKICVEGHIISSSLGLFNSSRDDNTLVPLPTSGDSTLVPYTIREGENLEIIAQNFQRRCGYSDVNATALAIVRENGLIFSPKVGELIRVPCSKGLQGCTDAEVVWSPNDCRTCRSTWVCGLPLGNFYPSQCDANLDNNPSTYVGFCNRCYAQCLNYAYQDMKFGACQSTFNPICPAPWYYSGKGCTYRRTECYQYCFRSARSYYWMNLGRNLEYCGYSGVDTTTCNMFYGRIRWCVGKCVEDESKYANPQCYFP